MKTTPKVRQNLTKDDLRKIQGYLEDLFRKPGLPPGLAIELAPFLELVLKLDGGMADFDQPKYARWVQDLIQNGKVRPVDEKEFRAQMNKLELENENFKNIVAKLESTIQILQLSNTQLLAREQQLLDQISSLKHKLTEKEAYAKDLSFKVASLEAQERIAKEAFASDLEKLNREHEKELKSASPASLQAVIDELRAERDTTDQILADFFYLVETAKQRDGQASSNVSRPKAEPESRQEKLIERFLSFCKGLAHHGPGNQAR